MQCLTMMCNNTCLQKVATLICSNSLSEAATRSRFPQPSIPHSKKQCPSDCYCVGHSCRLCSCVDASQNACLFSLYQHSKLRSPATQKADGRPNKLGHWPRHGTSSSNVGAALDPAAWHKAHASSTSSSGWKAGNPLKTAALKWAASAASPHLRASVSARPSRWHVVNPGPEAKNCGFCTEKRRQSNNSTSDLPCPLQCRICKVTCTKILDLSCALWILQGVQTDRIPTPRVRATNPHLVSQDWRKHTEPPIRTCSATASRCFRLGPARPAASAARGHFGAAPPPHSPRTAAAPQPRSWAGGVTWRPTGAGFCLSIWLGCCRFSSKKLNFVLVKGKYEGNPKR